MVIIPFWSLLWSKAWPNVMKVYCLHFLKTIKLPRWKWPDTEVLMVPTWINRSSPLGIEIVFILEDFTISIVSVVQLIMLSDSICTPPNIFLDIIHEKYVVFKKNYISVFLLWKHLNIYILKNMKNIAFNINYVIFVLFNFLTSKLLLFYRRDVKFIKQ